MKRFYCILLLLFSMVACSKPADLESKVFSMAEKGTHTASRYLAYQHTLHLDADAQKISGILNAALVTCREATTSSCTVMESKINSGQFAHASVTFRAKPEGIQKLMTSLRQQGEIIDQSTTAEDLAAPIEDTGKKLAMLLDYRTKLEALRSRASQDIDALIKVNHELAQVQSELEAAERKKAQLMQRVDTELLTVTISTKQQRGFWKPVGTAFGDFANNLSQGISTVITASAYLIPWLILLFILIWGGRKVWRLRLSSKDKK